MSLTQFLQMKEVRERFETEFELPDIRSTWGIKAPPLTNHYALVGTAFDYLLRFILRYHNTNCEEERWAAYESLAILTGNQPLTAADLPMFKLRELAEKFTLREPSDTPADLAKKITYLGEMSSCEYNESGKPTDQILASVLLLGQLDSVYHSGYVHKDMGVVDKRDVEDLKNLSSIVPLDEFKADSVCLLNPQFGQASQLVGGADADLVLDDSIIDIKTTKTCGFSRKMLNQLIGYYTLGRIGGIGECSLDGREIRRIGVYFSRFGKMLLVDTSDVIEKRSFPAFVCWFKERAEAYLLSGAF